MPKLLYPPCLTGVHRSHETGWGLTLSAVYESQIQLVRGVGVSVGIFPGVAQHHTRAARAAINVYTPELTV